MRARDGLTAEEALRLVDEHIELVVTEAAADPQSWAKSDPRFALLSACLGADTGAHPNARELYIVQKQINEPPFSAPSHQAIAPCCLPSVWTAFSQSR